MKFSSIRYKLVFATALLVTVLLVTVAVAAYVYFRSATQELIVGQQFSMISTMARDLDRSIDSAHKALEKAAITLPAGSLKDGKAMQGWLDDRVGMHSVFNHSLIVLDKSGILIASVPALPELYGVSFAHRDYFTETISTGRPMISKPFVTAVNDRPVIVMTVPLMGDDGEIAGVLAGSVDLLDKNGLFGVVKDTRVGASGYLYLFAQDRTMIMHPDTSRIMKQDVKPGANVFFDKALAGFEGSGETVNSRGVGFLVSFKRLQTTGWILAANYPLEEAFAPIARFRSYFLVGMVFVLLGAIALAWKLGDSFARPIEGIVKQLNRLAKPGSDRTERLDDGRNDEFGVLSASFNDLLDEILQGEKDLKTAQLNLYQSEKMASVGQLAAGVAHEINNPIGFINSNLGTLKGQVRDLLTVMAAYEQAEEALSGHPDMIASISQAKLAADLDFLRSDIESLITESLEGARRVKAIVEDLRDFSKLDTAEWQCVNLEKGLESTLSILSGEIRNKADVVREYAGLPEIECIASQINQVFMNLLLNAAQAIAEHGTITLRTGYNENDVWVEVEDTGVGIRPEHLARIFEPFFTTKQVGKGTGLGLSLAYGIIQHHHGRLEVHSEPDQGAVFRITLPRRRAGDEDGA